MPTKMKDYGSIIHPLGIGVMGVISICVKLIATDVSMKSLREG